jgi:hypothetical protein
MSPPLTESPSIINFIFPSSRGNPSFSSPSFFVTDSSLNLLTKVGFASSHNPISEPCSGSVFPDSGSALPEPGSVFPDSGYVLPEFGIVFLDNRFVLSRINFSSSCSRSEFSSTGFPLLVNAYLCYTKQTDATQKTPWLTT